ncbi:ankyrin repeat domain-containing protein [Mesorhizobium sp.]|uniref:ankyrin repeat domain-containing protein n=1 Tax=Mesorhizobium sp. TaxID=1871066 RepID=UPI003BAABB85
MKKLILPVFLILCGFDNVAAAAERHAASSVLPKDLSKLEGMYWYNSKTVFFHSGKTESHDVTDVLELVPYDVDSMYFRASLQFSNGHSCSISGIAERDQGRLTYYDTTYGNGCILHVVPTSTSVTLADPTGQCRAMSCGARGVYGYEQFSPRHKKKITYMAGLKNSLRYQEAVVNYDRLKLAKARGIAPEWSNARAMLGVYAFWGNLEGVRQALTQGASLEFDDKQTHGPVWGAGYSRDIGITQLLLDHGLNVNKLENGKTLLSHAAYNRPGRALGDQQFAYVKWLFEKGADASIADADGEKPVDIAIKTKADRRVVDLLKDKSEK